MGFDIYGERLARGHCEVHPWFAEEYPCSLCIDAAKTAGAARRAAAQLRDAEQCLALIEDSDEQSDPGVV
jgi:hypothetical protein